MQAPMTQELSHRHHCVNVEAVGRRRVNFVEKTSIGTS